MFTGEDELPIRQMFTYQVQVSSSRTFRMYFRLLAVQSQLRAKKCVHSKKYGQNLPIKRQDSWNEIILFPSLLYVYFVRVCLPRI